MKESKLMKEEQKLETVGQWIQGPLPEDKIGRRLQLIWQAAIGEITDEELDNHKGKIVEECMFRLLR